MKKQVKKNRKEEDAYELKRSSLFFKFMRAKRGLTQAESDRLLDTYKGWTWRSENKFPDFSGFMLYKLMKLYKAREEEQAEFKKKFPRNTKKYGDHYF